MKKVTIIGGGIAGLSAAVFLAEKNFKVTLLEASPKLGGRAYSFFDREKNQFFDNGQHILAGWYENTFRYLKITGSYDKLDFQESLEINFVNTKKETYKLKCPDMSPPYNILTGLLKFGAFSIKDKAALFRLNELFTNGNLFARKYKIVSELLNGMKQTDNLIKYFWEPFNLAVFNTKSENISTEVFINVIEKGFKDKNNSVLVIPKVNLNELLINDAVEFLLKNGSEIKLNTAVSEIKLNDSSLSADCLITENGEKIYSDYYISAVPFYGFRKLFDEKKYNDAGYNAEKLKPSCIVSIHLFFKDKLPAGLIPDNSFGMTGLIGTRVQWIFKRSESHLSLVISGADGIGMRELGNEEIFEICMSDLRSTIEGIDKLILSDYKIIKEKRATFIPDEESRSLRPQQITRYGNLFITGDWTDTGLPATIESAATSADICVSEILKQN